MMHVKFEHYLLLSTVWEGHAMDILFFVSCKPQQWQDSEMRELPPSQGKEDMRTQVTGIGRHFAIFNNIFHLSPFKQYLNLQSALNLKETLK